MEVEIMVDSWEDFRRFEEMMNRMFEEVWGRPRSRLMLPSGERGEVVPAESRKPFIDVVETDKEVIATAEMPGLEKSDIKINLTEDRLEISAETKHEENKEEKGYIYRERRSGSYYRAISLPSPVDTDNSKASYENGVLEIKMPKMEIKKKKPLKIE
jgi:HSP20 family protein